MRTASRAVAVSTASSLVAVVCATIAHGGAVVGWLWAVWALLAVATVGVVAADRARRGP